MDLMIENIFKASAWTMIPPRPYSTFHILFGSAGILTASLLAFRLRKKSDTRLLFICGLILSISELYKQGFLYYAVNNRHYDWWYFPFQLCSVPMYLCVLYPFFRRRAAPRVTNAVITFLQDFGLLGGIMALAEPGGLMHPYLFLTLHSFIWHFILIFIGLYCALSRTGCSLKGFTDTLPLFFTCAAIATFINTASHPYGNADMFYINPYYPNEQIVFHQIAISIGTVAGNLLYLCAVILGGFIFHIILEKCMISVHSYPKSDNAR